MKTSPALYRLAAAAYLAATLLAPLPTAAATQSFTLDTSFVIKGYTFVVKAGSTADSFSTTDSGFMVIVPANEAFIVRSSIENPMALENDGGLASCNVLQNQENQLVINGPRTVNVTVSATPCPKDNYSTNNTTLLAMSSPNGGETLTAGAQTTVFWQVTGGSPAAVRMRLSTDGGLTYPTSVFTDMVSNGYYQWTVPNVATTSHARLKIESVDAGNITAIAISQGDFTINGTAPAEQPPSPQPSPNPAPPPTPNQPGFHPPYDPANAVASAASIDDDKAFTPYEPPSGTVTCQVGSRIKGASSSAVYYCGADHKRHAFPNQKVHDSWYSGFNEVVTLTDDQLAAVPLGANVTYRPGVRLVKITTDPKVYAVDKDGTLRWVPDEWTAKKLYGDDWNKKVDDIPDAFFFDYKIGEQVPSQT